MWLFSVWLLWIGCIGNMLLGCLIGFWLLYFDEVRIVIGVVCEMELLVGLVYNVVVVEGVGVDGLMGVVSGFVVGWVLVLVFMVCVGMFLLGCWFGDVLVFLLCVVVMILVGCMLFWLF